MADELTSLLERFGVNYPNAPAPTAAMLAFMRGVGMTLDTAEDDTRTADLRLRSRATDARNEINRQNQRSTERLGHDQASRGVLSSGETNTKVGRLAEDKAKAEGDVEQALAEGVESNQRAFHGTRDNLRQTALERTLGMETDQAREKAALEAEERSWTRQTEANDLAYKRQKEAQDAAYAAQEEQFRKFYGVGV